jgi:hypothetical protein
MQKYYTSKIGERVLWCFLTPEKGTDLYYDVDSSHTRN